MTWTYSQATGKISQDGLILATGYSGAKEGKNNPAMEGVQKAGPLPRGGYAITDPYDTKLHGPYVLRLIADSTNKMFGRSGFLIHGDSTTHPGTASEGCIILARMVRERIWGSGDHRLEVV